MNFIVLALEHYTKTYYMGKWFLSLLFAFWSLKMIIVVIICIFAAMNNDLFFWKTDNKNQPFIFLVVIQVASSHLQVHLLHHHSCDYNNSFVSVCRQLETAFFSFDNLIFPNLSKQVDLHCFFRVYTSKTHYDFIVIRSTDNFLLSSFNIKVYDPFIENYNDNVEEGFKEKSKEIASSISESVPIFLSSLLGLPAQ